MVQDLCINHLEGCHLQVAAAAANNLADSGRRYHLPSLAMFILATASVSCMLHIAPGLHHHPIG